jgi:hypothetical protein
MKLAFIPPISCLNSLQKTDYQLALANVAGQEDYFKAYRTAADRGDYVILDNGAAEGEQVSDGMLLTTASMLHATEIVIPDTLYEDDDTIAKALAFQDTVADEYAGDDPFKYMFVAQGRNIADFMRCITWAIQKEWIDTIALPKHMLMTLGHSARINWAEWIRDRCDKPIHCLGFNKVWPMECRYLADQGIVRGIDTAMPYVASWYGVDLEVPGQKIYGRPERYFELNPNDSSDPALFKAFIAKNERVVMNWCGIATADES